MSDWLNGHPATQISMRDRGLLLADGHFTTAYVCEGRARLWSAHRERLADGCRRLGLAPPDWSGLAEEVAEACGDASQACVRITLTRGDAGRGYEGQWPSPAQRLIQISPFPDHYRHWQQAGIRVGVARQRLASGGVLAGVKTLARTEQVLLRREAQLRQLDELLVLDHQGYLLEAIAANLFFVIDGILTTPTLAGAGVAGIMRRHVMSLALAQGVPVVARPIHADELADCSAAFITNCLMGVVPLRQIGERYMTDRTLADTLLDVGKLWR